MTYEEIKNNNKVIEFEKKWHVEIEPYIEDGEIIYEDVFHIDVRYDAGGWIMEVNLMSNPNEYKYLPFIKEECINEFKQLVESLKDMRNDHEI